MAAGPELTAGPKLTAGVRVADGWLRYLGRVAASVALALMAAAILAAVVLAPTGRNALTVALAFGALVVLLADPDLHRVASPGPGPPEVSQRGVGLYALAGVTLAGLITSFVLDLPIKALL